MSKTSVAFRSAIAILFFLLSSAGIFAETFGPESVKIQTEGYENQRGIVTFHHERHVLEYKLSCGECHHDDSGAPLASFSMGDRAPNCINCHDLDFIHESHTPEMDVNCGECHMDKHGNPLEVLEIQKCIDCHDKPGRSPIGLRYPKISKKERLEYHGDAMHYMCRGCHREYNKENADRIAPIACNECHPKTEKK
jgi:hypothetical protein